MDPSTTLTRVLRGCDDGDLEEVQEALENLSQWLKRGGYLPRVEVTSGDMSNFECRVISD